MGKVLSHLKRTAAENDRTGVADTEGQGVTLGSLHIELVIEVLEYLDKQSLVSFARTCSKMKQLAYSPQLWKDTKVSVTKYPLKHIDAVSAKSFRMRQIATVLISDDHVNAYQPIKNSLKTRICQSLNACSTYLDVTHMLVYRKEGLYWTDRLDKSFPLIEPHQLAQFTQLRCLHLEHCYIAHVVQLLNLHRKLKSWLPSLVNLEQLTYKSQVYSMEETSVDELKELYELDYITIIWTNLPKLKMLTVEEVHATEHANNGLMREAFAKAKIPRSTNENTPPLVCLRIRVPYFWRNLQNLRDRLPNIMSLGLDLQNPLPIAEILKAIPQLKSLKLETVERLNFRLAQVTPNLEALHLKGLGWVSYQNSQVPFNALSRQKEHNSEAYSNLKLLELDNKTSRGSNLVISANLCQVISQVQSLKVLILGRKSTHELASTSRAKFFEAIQTLHQLQSLLGAECKDASEDLPQFLRYITSSKDAGSTTPEQTLLELTEVGTRRIMRNSPKWHEAYGTRYWTETGRMTDLES